MNKLFNLLVLAGLPTAACAGEATDNGPGDQTETGGSESTGGDDSGGTLTGGAHSGGSSSSAGGAPSSGGSGAGGSGGTSDGGCPSEQWTCEGLTCEGATWDTIGEWNTASDCACDPTRPAGPEACAANEMFICDAASEDLSASGLLSCSCVPDDAEDRCGTNNPAHYTAPDPDDDMLCGCALPLIK